jgi:hypothetical protein
MQNAEDLLQFSKTEEAEVESQVRDFVKTIKINQYILLENSEKKIIVKYRK